MPETEQSQTEEDSGSGDEHDGGDEPHELISPQVRISFAEASDDEDFPKEGEPKKSEHGQLSPEISVTVTPASASTSAEYLSTPQLTDPEPADTAADNDDVEQGASIKEKRPWFVLPLYAVLGSASVGFLAFLNTSGAGAQAVSYCSSFRCVV